MAPLKHSRCCANAPDWMELGLAFTPADVRRLKSENGLRIVGLDVAAAYETEDPAQAMKTVEALLDWKVFEGIDEDAIAEAQQMIGSKSLEFLSYRDVPVLFALGDWISRYVGRCLYLSKLFTRVTELFPDAAKWILPVSASTAGWPGLDNRLIRQVAETVCGSKGIELRTVTAKANEAGGGGRGLWGRRLERIYESASRGLMNRLLRSAGRDKLHVLVVESSSWSYVRDGLKDIRARITFFGSEVARSALKVLGLRTAFLTSASTFHVKDLLAKPALRAVDEQVDRFRRHWQEKRESILRSFSERPAAVRENVGLLVDHLLQTEAKATLQRIEATHRLLEREGFDIVLTRIDARDMYRIVPMMARARGIPSVTVQHGAIGTEDTAYGFVPIVSDRLAVYGPGARRVLENLGEPSDRIAEVGSCRFDQYQRNGKTRPIGAKPLVLIVAPSVITGMTRSFINRLWTSCDVQACARAVAEALRRNADIRVIAKFHPSDSLPKIHRRMFEEAAGENADRLTVAFREPIEPMVERADIIVSNRSTVGLEAMLNGTPLVEMDFKQTTLNAKTMSEAGAARIARSADELVNHVVDLATDQDARDRLTEAAGRFVHENYLFDGKASQRTAKLIRELASG